VAADSDELMDPGHCSQSGIIPNLHVSCQGDHIRYDDVVAQPAIVTHMAVSHDETVIANDCLAASFCRPSVNRYEFPNNRILTDLQIGFFSLIAKMLGGSPQNCMGEDLAAIANLRPPVD
jgi:hypothetical protein